MSEIKPLTTDQLIQLGGLVVAAIGLFGGVAYFIIRILYFRYFGLVLKVELAKESPIYISHIEINTDSQPRVSAVTKWAKLHIYNRTPTPKVLTEILTYYKGTPPERIDDFPVRLVTFSHDDAIPENPIILPYTIGTHDGITMWALVRIRVHGEFGKALFKFYGQKAANIQSVKAIINHRKEMQSQILSELRDDTGFVQIVDFKIGDVELHVPILERTGSEITISTRFGHIPHNTKDLWNYMFKESDNASLDFLIPFKHFITRLNLANGKSITHKLKIKNYALWFK